MTAIAGTDAAAREAILTALEQIAEPLMELVELDHGAGSDRKRVPAIVIVTLGEDHATWALQVEEIRQVAASAAVIGAIAGNSGSNVRQALRAGVDDVFFLPVEPSDLSRCLVRVGETSRRGQPHSATVCSFASVAGGVGVSSLALALAFALHRQAARRVALLDLGLQCGTLAAMLGLAPEVTISQLVDPASTIDSLRLESALVTHRSGLYLLAAPKRIEESEIVSVSTITAVLEVMRELFDFVLIDCGHHMNEALIAAWEQSTTLVYVVEQSIGSVRPAQRFLEMFERLGLTELDLRFVLNRYEPASPFTDAKITSVLRRPLAARIPRDDASFLQFQIECDDLARIAPRSPARLAIEELGAALSGNPGAFAADGTQPRLARMRGALAANLLHLLAGRKMRRAGKLPAADV